MKKRWLFLSATVAMLALGVLMTGAAFAQEASTDDQSRVGKLASRVAQILGLGEDEVSDAINQARTELRIEAAQNKLDRMVEAGTLTQEQADEYIAWLEAQPDDGPGFGHNGFGGKRFGRHGRGVGGHGRGHFSAPQAPLDGTLAAGDDAL